MEVWLCGYVREGGQGGPFLEGAGAAGGFIRASGHRTLSSGGAASKALTTKKTEVDSGIKARIQGAIHVESPSGFLRE